MGWKDAQWAYAVDEEWDYKLPLPQKAVLAALCLRASDKTHQTFVGQQTIADMTGASKATVGRALGVLERDNFITREVRHGPSGYRTSDLLTVRLDVTEPSRQSAYKAESNRQHVTVQSTTRQSATAEENIQGGHSGGHSVLPLTEGAKYAEPLCDVLLECLRANKVAKAKVSKAWLDAARLMVDNDHRDPHEARALIKWATSDSFWRANILSMPKFREKYDTLRLRAQMPDQRNDKKLTPDERALQTLSLVVDNSTKGITA